MARSSAHVALFCSIAMFFLLPATGGMTPGKPVSFCGIGCDDVCGALMRRYFEEAMMHRPDAACSAIVKTFLCEKCVNSQTQPFNLTADLPVGSSLPGLLCRSPPAASSSSVNHPNRKGSQSLSDGEYWVLIAMGTALVLAIAICVAIVLLHTNGECPKVYFGDWFSGNKCFIWGNRAGDAASAAAASEDGTELGTV